MTAILCCWLHSLTQFFHTHNRCFPLLWFPILIIGGIFQWEWLTTWVILMKYIIFMKYKSILVQGICSLNPQSVSLIKIVYWHPKSINFDALLWFQTIFYSFNSSLKFNSSPNILTQYFYEVLFAFEIWGLILQISIL